MTDSDTSTVDGVAVTLGGGASKVSSPILMPHSPPLALSVTDWVGLVVVHYTIKLKVTYHTLLL